MAYTLSQALQAIYKQLGQLEVNVATGGSTTTVVDSKQAGKFRDNSLKNGAAFIIRDSGGASAAPEGEFSLISANTNSSGTFTLVSTLTAAVASGDTYGIVTEYYPLQQMIQAVNDGLRTLGDLEFNDSTTLDTVAGDTEYSAAVAWKRGRPSKLWIQGRTGDAQDNQWQEVTDFDWEPATAGSAGRLIFNFYPFGSRDVKIRYLAPHGTVNAFNDPIDERIAPKVAVAAALVEALQWQNARVQGADQFLLQLQNKAMQDVEKTKAEAPITRQRRTRRKFIVNGYQDDDDVFTVPTAP